LALRPTRPQSPSDKLAERDAAQQDALLREVDDALREDEMLGVFRRYGVPVIAAVLLGLAGLGGFLWWKGERADQQAVRGEHLTKALDRLAEREPKFDAANKQLDVLAKEDSGGPKAAAVMLRASIAVEQGHNDEAAKLFASVAADEGAPQPYRDLATIREVTLKFDTMPPQQVVTRLKPLAIQGKPWFGSAGELLGLAYLKLGQNNLAGPLFAAIAKDRTVPASLCSRAVSMAGVLGVDAIADVTKDPCDPFAHRYRCPRRSFARDSGCDRSARADQCRLAPGRQYAGQVLWPPGSCRSTTPRLGCLGFRIEQQTQARRRPCRR